VSVAGRLGRRAAETLVLENDRKHVREVREIVSAGGDVVDLGGGLGVNLLMLRELGHDGRLALVDRFEEYDEANPMGARERALPLLHESAIEVVELDFWPDGRLPFGAGEFGVACCYDVVEHLPGHPLRQLEELRRVLRPGGTCLLSGPNAVALMKRVKVVLGRHPYSGYDAWVSDRYFEHYREYLRHEYEDLLWRAGFEDVRSDMAADVTVSRAAHRYHRRRRSPLSPVTLALVAAAGLEVLVPGLRHTVHVRGRAPR
jgi:SAM-dependent methyltransferase